MGYKKDGDGGLVYSTEHGRMCPVCGLAVGECVCQQRADEYSLDGIVRVSRETKGRKGKGVTVITGVPLDKGELKKLGRELKARCGAGGTVKDGIIEIQGEFREKVTEELKKKGWEVRG